MLNTRDKLRREKFSILLYELDDLCSFGYVNRDHLLKINNSVDLTKCHEFDLSCVLSKLRLEDYNIFIPIFLREYNPDYRYSDKEKKRIRATIFLIIESILLFCNIQKEIRISIYNRVRELPKNYLIHRFVYKFDKKYRYIYWYLGSHFSIPIYKYMNEYNDLYKRCKIELKDNIKWQKILFTSKLHKNLHPEFIKIYKKRQLTALKEATNLYRDMIQKIGTYL